MRSLIFYVLEAYTSYCKKRFIRKTRQLRETQTQFLMELMRSHQNTVLGQEFKLARIKTVEQFRQQVPIWDYNRYEPYTDRIAQGEKNVLNPDPVIYINLTSGSTGNKKQVPVTEKYQRTLRKADLTGFGFAITELKRHHQSLNPMLITNCVKLQGTTEGGIEYGPVSVGSIRKGKLLFEQMFTLPFPVLEIVDTDTRHYVCLLFALRNPNLGGMIANFPMLLLRTCQYLEQYETSLIEDLKTGSLASWLKLEPEERAWLEQQWQPAAPQRVTYLEQLLKSEGRLIPYQVWPKLAVLLTAQGGTSGFYLQRFPDYFGDIPSFGGVYGTAEATLGICFEFNNEGAILAIESGFFEFIPMDQWEAEQPKTLWPDEVRVGDRYRVLLTTYSGFYRYDIGDVVEVLGFYHQTPIIVFRHRRGGLLSSTTEKTTEFHVVEVMKQLQTEFEVHLEDFCITLSEDEFPAAYLVNIELAPGYSLMDPEKFIQRFDEWMAKVNEPYGTVRSSQVPPPQLRVLAPGSFAKLRENQVHRGMFDSQLKIPHISEDRDFFV